MDNNTLSGFHIKSKKGEPLKIYPKKYTWHIPKKLRYLNFQPGDIVGVAGVDRKNAPVLVTDVFREELEDTGKSYKRIVSLRERGKKMRLDEYEKRFQLILKMDKEQSEKDALLSVLMTDLERKFDIPMSKDKAWEQENPEVYALYRKVADSRLL